MKINNLILILLFILPCISSFAQNAEVKYRVSGKVINSADKKPVTGASVFIGNATIGDETDNNGNFTLQVKPGKYTLIISSIGFEIFTAPLAIVNNNIKLPDIEMVPASVTLAEVKIKASAGKDAYSDWAHDTFIKEFFGPSDYAKECKILNPQVLNVEYDQSTNTITASSTDFLQIKNKALGYDIKYKLTKFQFSTNSQNDKNLHYEGSVFFREMAGTPRQEQQWKQNREEIYGNSITHFLRAAQKDRLDEEGFRAFRLGMIVNPYRPDDKVIKSNLDRLRSNGSQKSDSIRYWNKIQMQPRTISVLLPMPLTKANMVSNTDNPGVFAFGDNNDPVLVQYNKNGHFTNIKQLTDLVNLNYILNKAGNKELTLVSFNEPQALFDNNGGVFNPNSLAFKGAWIENRVANLLPVDYEGGEAKAKDRSFKDDTLLKNIVRATNAYNMANPVEKAYLHLDRSSYLPGDTVWFKAYTILGDQHQLSDKSGVLYTELINSNDSVVLRHTIRLYLGLGIGDFDLPTVLKPGVYRIRAYTNYMRNAGPDYFCTQNIQIGDAADVQHRNAQNLRANPDVQFFPEGGDLVDGLTSRVAVKAIGTNGLGENITGIIVDDSGNEVTRFATTHLGMGVFSLSPQQGKKYRANITGADRSMVSVDLPLVREKGFALTITNKPDSINIKIAANDKLLKENKGSQFYLMAQSGGKVYYSSAAGIANHTFETNIAKKRFPSGIAQFTLLSRSGEPLNERIIFIRTDDTLKLSLSTASSVYAPRQKVIVDMGVTGENVSALGSFSVSVINESRVPVNENTETTILNSLLLTSDLKGYIEQPNYYFLRNDAKTAADLDLLMLTQGYRHYDWKSIVNTLAKRLNYKPESSLSFEGDVKTTSGKPVPNAKVTFVASRQNFFTDTLADANGHFVLNNINLPDSAIVVVRGNKQNNSGNVDLRINEPKYAPVPGSRINADTVNTSSSLMLEDHTAQLKQLALKNGIQLKEVKINSTAIRKPNLSYSANLNGPGNADQIIMGETLFGCVNLADCLNGKVFGIRFKNGDAYNNRQAARFGSGGSGATDPPPLTIILDGMIMHAKLYDINASDIYSIEVLRSGAYSAIYGSEAFSGALVITTKRGNEHKNIVSVANAGLITYPFKGYYLAKTFYSPKYDVPQFLKTSDNRSTIYWQPDIVTGNDGKASFEYYNADTKGIYRVVVEGIDDKGNIGRQVYRYEVK